jgi:hypothetical protein
MKPSFFPPVALAAILIPLSVTASAVGHVPGEEITLTPEPTDAYATAAQGLRLPSDQPYWDIIENGWLGQHAELRQTVEANGSILDEMKRIEREGLFEPDPPKWDLAKTGELVSARAEIREVARQLVCRGKLHESQSRYAEAVDDYLAVVRVGKDIERGGTIIHKLVGVACQNMAYSAIRRSLAQRALDKDSTFTLLEGLKATRHKGLTVKQLMDNFLLAVQEGLDKGKRDITNTEKATREAIDDLRTRSGIGAPPPDPEGAEQLEAQLAMLKSMDRDDLTRQMEQYRDAVGRALSHDYCEADGLLSGYNAPAVSAFFEVSLIRNVLAAQTRTDAQASGMLIFVELEAYQYKNGRYPLSLGSLTPGFLETIPVDPYSGKTFKYTARGGGTDFTLYSIGPDGVSDGGKIDVFETSKVTGWRNNDGEPLKPHGDIVIR